ncbi:hypothetical protein ACFLYU_05790 [Candidatus Dependentiae bacterium]
MRMSKILIIFLLLHVATNAFSSKGFDIANNGVDGDKTLAYKEFLELNDKGLLNSLIGHLGGLLSVAEDVAYTLLTPVQELIKQNTPAIYENPFRTMHANVRFGGPVCLQELLYRDERFKVVKQAQEKMLGMELEKEDVLDIGFSLSGGGWRAMCCSLGSCVGAKKIGLLDSTMCMSALSGSTWFLGPWIYSGMHIYDYRKRAIKVAGNGIKIKNMQEASDLLDNVWVKFAYNQPLNVIDLYGALLANSLFRGLTKEPHRALASDQRRVIAKGEFPLPVCTAVLGEAEKDEFWFEFTPYEVGSRWLSAYVPAWAFGRHFKRGKSKTHAPEQNLGFCMGLWGSAFAADFEDMYEIVLDGIKFPKFLKNIPFAEAIFKTIKQVFAKLAYSDLGDLRVAWARVPNYVYKLQGAPHNKYKELKLVDAGLDLNNPVFSTYRRPPYGDAPDIIFVFDSGGSLKFKELQLWMNYADYNGLKFPKIEKFEVGKQIIKVFKDDSDLDVPVVVYLPRINGIQLIQKNNYKNWYDYYLELLDGFDIEKVTSSGFAKTFNFKYTEKQAETLIAMTEFNIIAVEDKVKEIMRDRIKLKRQFRTLCQAQE